MGHTCRTGYCSWRRRSGGGIPHFGRKGGARGAPPATSKRISNFEQDYCRFGGSTPGQLGKMLRKLIFSASAASRILFLNASPAYKSQFSLLAPPLAYQLVVAQSKDCMSGLTGVRVADPGQTHRRGWVGDWEGDGK